jgi:hypothetical protein
MARLRATDVQKAERLNLARSLLRQTDNLSQAAEQLAQTSSISKVQAYRYLKQAEQLKQPVPVGEAKLSFTVKLSRSLIHRLRAYAASTGLTLSEIVSRAVVALLHRGGRRG